MDTQTQGKLNGSPLDLPLKKQATNVPVVEICVLLSQKQANQLETSAYQKGLSTAQMLRQILRHQLEKTKQKESIG